MLTENSLPSVQSKTLRPLSASLGTGADAFVEIRGYLDHVQAKYQVKQLRTKTDLFM